ncbi:MAG: hypothetical protein KAG86_09695, partial [Gammaproteobacteria bacterium]|nr:hypothetical protein [Gammaproteobacteria bacterium]
DDISHQGLMFVNTKEALDASSFDMKKRNLNDNKVEYLVDFLKSLTDPCTKDLACLNQWIPDPDPFDYNYPDWD